MTTDTNLIADALHAPRQNVAENWPTIRTCLEALGMGGDNTLIAALATIRVECPPFKPVHEYGTDAAHEKAYGHRKDLGNAHDGDGAKYAGRGYIQITGEVNYANYGKQLGIDLVSNPDEALETNTAAAIFAAYFHERGCDKAAEKEDWVRVRKLVNGGTNGLEAFLKYIEALKPLKG